MIESAKLRVEKEADMAKKKVVLLHESGTKSHLINMLVLKLPNKEPNQTSSLKSFDVSAIRCCISLFYNMFFVALELFNTKIAPYKQQETMMVFEKKRLDEQISESYLV